MQQMTDAVRKRYAEAARRMGEAEACGCGDCCGSGYQEQALLAVGVPASSSLGCGNPTALADMKAGERVLDLGSGAGLDVLLSARRVSPGGHAYGVDMTAEMIALAERNRERAGVENATFLKGTIEEVPLPDAAVDVVISNCVINLAVDKAAALREAFRVLRPGGRLAIADMVEVQPLPASVKGSPDAWADCIAGAIPAEQYEELLRAAGFDEVSIETQAAQGAGGGPGEVRSAYIRARKPRA